MTANLSARFCKVCLMAVAALTAGIDGWVSGGWAGGISVAVAEQGPEPENGRYALSPVADGIIRLDTRTGAVSSCTNNGNGWACYAVPDERAAFDAEIGRLLAENDKQKAELETLKTELLARPSSGSDINEPQPPPADPPKADLPKSDLSKSDLPKTDLQKPADGERRIEIPLPSDRDMDRAMAVLEQAWRRLVEMASRMQKDVSGRI
jgi:hypothetical protein